jgi:hypothetical protein
MPEQRLARTREAYQDPPRYDGPSWTYRPMVREDGEQVLLRFIAPEAMKEWASHAGKV